VGVLHRKVWHGLAQSDRGRKPDRKPPDLSGLKRRRQNEPVFTLHALHELHGKKTKRTHFSWKLAAESYFVKTNPFFLCVSLCPRWQKKQNEPNSFA
jgi:hypothetical protein